MTFFIRLLRGTIPAPLLAAVATASTPDLPALWAERVKCVVAVEYVTVTETERRPTVSMGTVVDAKGTITALAPGDAVVEAKIPGLAARSGFLFIKALGQVGFYTDGAVNWDIAILVAAFGASLFASQILSGMGMPANPQQATANKITPVMITGMFLFFPLPAGVLLYMVVANIFQAVQTFLLTRESLPDNLQAILDQQMAQQTVTATATTAGSERLPFEPKGKK